MEHWLSIIGVIEFFFKALNGLLHQVKKYYDLHFICLRGAVYPCRLQNNTATFLVSFTLAFAIIESLPHIGIACSRNLTWFLCEIDYDEVNVEKYIHESFMFIFYICYKSKLDSWYLARTLAIIYFSDNKVNLKKSYFRFFTSPVRLDSLPAILLLNCKDQKLHSWSFQEDQHPLLGHSKAEHLNYIKYQLRVCNLTILKQYAEK